MVTGLLHMTSLSNLQHQQWMTTCFPKISWRTDRSPEPQENFTQISPSGTGSGWSKSSWLKRAQHQKRPRNRIPKSKQSESQRGWWCLIGSKRHDSLLHHAWKPNRSQQRRPACFTKLVSWSTPTTSPQSNSSNSSSTKASTTTTASGGHPWAVYLLPPYAHCWTLCVRGHQAYRTITTQEEKDTPDSTTWASTT